MQSALAGMTAGVLLQLLRRNSHANEMGSNRADREARPRLSSRFGGRTLMLPMGIACGALLALLAYALLVGTLVGRAADTAQRDTFLMHVHPYLFLVPVRTSSGSFSLWLTSALLLLILVLVLVLEQVLAFVALRNSWDALRRRYSPLFAWFGRISLEVRASRTNNTRTWSTLVRDSLSLSIPFSF